MSEPLDPNSIDSSGMAPEDASLSPPRNGQSVNGQSVNGQSVNGQSVNGQILMASLPKKPLPLNLSSCLRPKMLPKKEDG
ncbi:MAG: hypothetical protein AAGL08_04620 [Cyanobacteria bacterium J06573_11]